MTKNGGPAFPVGAIEDEEAPGSFHGGYTGMTLRDYFAAKAMHQFLEGAVLPPGFDASEQLAWLGARSYEVADAMLRAREGGAA